VDYHLNLYRDGYVPTASDVDQTQGFVSGAAPIQISGRYLPRALKDKAPEFNGKCWDGR
jgi:multiple sugar transport system substrate-binding protein